MTEEEKKRLEFLLLDSDGEGGEEAHYDQVQCIGLYV